MNIVKMTSTNMTTYSPGRTISYLAVHYTAGVSCKAGAAAGCASWFANQASNGSADYICDEATFVQYNPDPRNRYCAAVGGSRYNTKGGRLYGVAKNSNCVSLEICSGNTAGKITYPNDPNYYFTDAVLAKAIECVQYLMQEYGIDADHVIRHYDVNGKQCPGIIGWNADSGSEEKWEAFHKAIGGTPIQYYRVGTAWENGKCVNQIGAYTILDNAKAAADTCGYNVYDAEGVRIYTGTSPVASGSTQASVINALANESLKAAAMLELVYKNDKSGILPSVSTAQMILESGYCSTELAQKANNCFGMKCNLSGNTWQSVWDGTSKVNIRTPEEYQKGVITYIYADFRKYPCIEDSVRDHSCYLLGAMNGSKKRYAGLTDCKDYTSAITLIKNGGYATDSKYISKICNIIERFGLDKYDKAAPAPTPEPTPVTPEPTPVTPDPTPEKTGKTVYRVQVGAFSDSKKAATRLILAQSKIAKDSYVVQETDGLFHVYVMSFESRPSAESVAAEIEKKGICEACVEARIA